MKKLLATMFAASISFGATMSHAGGPIVIDDEEVVAEKPASSIGILPILIGIVVVCAIVCNQDDEEDNL